MSVNISDVLDIVNSCAAVLPTYTLPDNQVMKENSTSTILPGFQ